MTNPQFTQQSPAAAPVTPPVTPPKDNRPSGRVLAGAGSLLAVLAFLGGMAVGHAWDGSSTTPTQFGPGGGGFRQFPGNGQQIPGQQVPPGQQTPGQQNQGQPG